MTLETKRYLYKPFEITAVQLTPFNFKEVEEWCGGAVTDIKHRPFTVGLTVPNFKGNQRATTRLIAKQTLENIQRLEYLAEAGRLDEYEQVDDISYTGDYIAREGNRFTVISQETLDGELLKIPEDIVTVTLAMISGNNSNVFTVVGE